MITAAITILVVLGAVSALAGFFGRDMRRDARDRDAVARLFRDPFEGDR